MPPSCRPSLIAAAEPQPEGHTGAFDSPLGHWQLLLETCCRAEHSKGRKTARCKGQAMPPPSGPHVRWEPTGVLGTVRRSDGGTSLTSGRGCSWVLPNFVLVGPLRPSVLDFKLSAVPHRHHSKVTASHEGWVTGGDLSASLPAWGTPL